VTWSELAAIVLFVVGGIALFWLQNWKEGRRPGVTALCRARDHERCAGITLVDDGSTADCRCACHHPVHQQPPFL
jgi:hypothetical protein